MYPTPDRSVRHVYPLIIYQKLHKPTIFYISSIVYSTFIADSILYSLQNTQAYTSQVLQTPDLRKSVRLPTWCIDELMVMRMYEFMTDMFTLMF